MSFIFLHRLMTRCDVIQLQFYILFIYIVFFSNNFKFYKKHTRVFNTRKSMYIFKNHPSI